MCKKSWKKSVLAAAVLLFVGILGGTLPTSAAYQDEPQLYYFKETGEPSDDGFQEYGWFDGDGNQLTDREINGEPISLAAEEQVEALEALPEKYDMREDDSYVGFPAVRNQGKFGTCWAHAAVVSAETNLLKKRMAGEGVDYSERHLAYFAHRKDPITGDGADQTSSFGYFGGGNIIGAVSALANWYGLAYEEDFPYEGCSADITEDNIPADRRTQSEAHLVNASQFDAVVTVDSETKTCTYDAARLLPIKRAVMETGAVAFMYKTQQPDSQTYVYHSASETVDHGVAIIGWDDTISREKFVDSKTGKMPESGGGWLVRNSWGESKGEQGYFYLSYEDATAKNYYSLEMDAPDNYDTCYSYDGAGYGGMWAVDAANIFTAEGLEELCAVGVFSTAGAEYAIEIYVQDEGEMAAPDDGKRVLIQTGALAQGGYHTIPLQEKTVVTAGQHFSVVVTMKRGNGAKLSFWEAEKDAEGKYAYGKGQSFFRIEGKGWTDAYHYDGVKNTCIKAFTKNLTAMSVESESVSIRESAARQLTAEQIKALLPSELSVKMDSGAICDVPVIWSTATPFDPKGGSYLFEGTLQDGNPLKVTAAVEIVPVVLIPPAFLDGTVPRNKNAGMKASDFSGELLPTTGWYLSNGIPVSYVVRWDGTQALDATKVGNLAEFWGEITYKDVPDYYTLPMSNRVVKRITVTDCAHSWGEEKTVTPPSCVKEGKKEAVCALCGDSKTQPIEKNAHQYQSVKRCATTKKDGAVIDRCGVCGEETVKSLIPMAKKAVLSKSSYAYDGKAKKPSVTVKDAKGNTIAASNYSVSYGGNKKIGKATVTVKLKNDYTGTLTASFSIVPKGTSVTKLTAKKKGFEVKWKKQTAGTAGYQLQYSTYSKFTDKTTVTISKTKTLSKSVNKLAAGKLYYVRVRTYAKVGGKKYYSSWSDTKKVRTKK